MIDKTYDIIVVGAGNAAFAAALAAHQLGAGDILVLEKAPKAERGGNTRFTGGVMRVTYRGLEDLIPLVGKNGDPDAVVVDPYPAEQFRKDIERVTGGRNDPELTEVMIARSYETVKWMSGLGIGFEFGKVVGAAKVPGQNKTKLALGAALRTHHEGIGLSDGWFKIAENAGIDVLYGAQATRLLTDERGRVNGVEIRGDDGVEKLSAAAVILASGGFQASPEMRTAYLGPAWSLVKVRGSRFDTGEMTRAALDLGAQPYGQWAGCHATPIDADAPVYGDLRLTDKTNRLSYPYSVLINLDGKRFLDEGIDFNGYTYAKYGGEILKERNSMAFEIFDQQTIGLLEPRYSTGTPVEGNTLAEIVDGIAERYGVHGFDKAAALATLERYNEAANDPAPFNPTILDGKRTRGLDPEKTNWATRLEKPPFVVYPVTGGITFTFGGLRIDTTARVLDLADRPIVGLYACGENTGGFFYHNYPVGSGLTRGAVYGKISGEQAAAFVKGTRAGAR